MKRRVFLKSGAEGVAPLAGVTLSANKTKGGHYHDKLV
jgi:hypothetical protein